MMKNFFVKERASNSNDKSVLADANHLTIFHRCLMGGGAERILLNLAQHFVESGVKVDLILSRANGPLLDSIPHQVNIIDLKAPELDKGRWIKLPTSFSSTTSLLKLIVYLRKERPQAILTAGHFSNEIAIVAKYLAGVSTEVIVSEHIKLSTQAERVEQLSSRLATFTARHLYSLADGVIAVSDAVAQDLAQITKLPPEKIQVIYNPVIPPDLREKTEQSVEHPWFAPGEPPVILGVGRFVRQKDFPTLIRAFALVHRVKPCRLVILGSGREDRALKSLIAELKLEDSVALPGFVKNPFAYMAKASVFVLSSAWEGLPTVLIEAMASGTPVISTDCSGASEILADGKYGTLVPIGDSQAIADAILDVLAGKTQPIDTTWLEQFTFESAAQMYGKALKIPLTPTPLLYEN